MSLTTKQKQQLKARAHPLKPVIMIGNQGLTPAVLLETEQALVAHELIKVRINSEDRELRRQIIAEICQAQDAELVQIVGKIGVIYRKKLS